MLSLHHLVGQYVLRRQVWERERKMWCVWTVNMPLQRTGRVFRTVSYVSLKAPQWTRRMEPQMSAGDSVSYAQNITVCACAYTLTDNLRYALSTCVFGFPQEKISTSTPCQVSCEPLRSAIGHNLNTNATLEDLSYCSLSSFQDTVGINRCAACYGRMDGEAYMANCM